MIDTKSVYDAFYKGECASSGISLKEKHAALDLLAITEKLRSQNTALLWVASGAQLADGLTKAAAAEALLYFPQQGQLRVVKKDPEFIAAKKKAKRLVGTAYLKLLDLTWQQRIARHDPTTNSENLGGMAVFLVQPRDAFTSHGGACHNIARSCGSFDSREPFGHAWIYVGAAFTGDGNMSGKLTVAYVHQEH